MSVLQKLADRFMPVITIHVDAAEIVFRRGTEEARSQPLIRFAEDGTIIEIGQRATTAKGGRLIRLFGAGADHDHDAIRAFCRYHIMMTASGNVLRPRVRIIEPTFRNAFGPHAATAVQDALRADRFHADITEETSPVRL